MDSANPEMLVLAREIRGWTQAEVAERTGIVQGTVSKYENGTLDVPEDHLRKIAKALTFPVEFFGQRDRVFGSMCLHHRKRQTLSVKQLRQIHAKFNVIVMQIRRLLQSVEIDCTHSFPVMSIEEYGSPENIARHLRATWRMPSGPVRNLATQIESAGAVIFTLGLDTEKFDALSLWAPDLPPVLFVNEKFPGDRLRFNLAHELGHLIMHATPSADQEAEADRFASEFLMPAEEIKPQLTRLTFERLATLKSYWKVSIQALIVRAHTLGTITERQMRTLFMKMSANGWRKREPVDVPVEKPTVVKSLVDVHLKEHGYTVSELCEAIRASEADFRNDYLEEAEQGLRIFR